MSSIEGLTTVPAQSQIRKGTTELITLLAKRFHDVERIAPLDWDPPCDATFIVDYRHNNEARVMLEQSFSDLARPLSLPFVSVPFSGKSGTDVLLGAFSAEAAVAARHATEDLRKGRS